MNRDNQKRVNQFNIVINNLRNSDKYNQTKIQKAEIQALKTNEKIDKLNK